MYMEIEYWSVQVTGTRSSIQTLECRYICKLDIHIYIYIHMYTRCSIQRAFRAPGSEFGAQGMPYDLYMQLLGPCEITTW